MRITIDKICTYRTVKHACIVLAGRFMEHSKERGGDDSGAGGSVKWLSKRAGYVMLNSHEDD